MHRPAAANRKTEPALASLAALSLLLFAGCASPPTRTATTFSPNPAPAQIAPPPPNAAAVGVASYYGHPYHGRRTASGEIYDMRKMTAAHRPLPFGVNVRVTALSQNRSVIVRINDRRPFKPG